MSLSQRTQMRRCGHRFATEEDAARHKLALNGSRVVVPCTGGCGGWHHGDPGSPEPPKRSAPKAARPFPPDVADALDERDERCQRCGSTEELERHHRRLKGIGGSRGRHTQCTCNGVRLCRSCHRWAHGKDRPEAEAQGFIVSQSVDEPRSVSVMRFAAADGGATQFPTCDGQWVSTAAQARVAA